MFDRFGFKAKLLLLCGFLCAVNVLIGATSFSGLRRVVSEYDLVADKALPKVTSLAEMFLQFRDIRINLRSLGLPGVTLAQEKEFIEAVKKSMALYEKANADYLKGGFSPGEKELYDQVAAAWKTFSGVGERVFARQAERTEQAHARMIEIFLKDCPEAAQAYLTAMTSLKDFHLEHAQNYVASAKSESSFSNVLSLFIMIGGALIGLAFGFIFSQSLSNTIAQIVSLLRDNAQQVSTAASEIALASQELSQATTQQAASLEETAAALEELSSMVQKNLDSARGTARVSEESKDSASKGHSTVGQMIVSMGDIRKSNDQISDIVRVIGDIDAKTKVINDIVFQTKLLSFNASVEAARAGEQGRGFSVVAEEVGKLAQMSGNAAREISGLLSESIQKVETIVNDSKGKVSSGETWTQECGGILEEIVGNVSRVSTMASEISLASDEQSRGVQEISKAMTELDQVTQKNASTSERCAVAAEQLSRQSQTLNKTVEKLVHVLSGEKAA